MTVLITAAARPGAPELLLAGYVDALARLRAAATRQAAAVILDEMASQAAGIAAQLYGRGAEGGDTDPLAWHDVNTFLLSLAAAERGLILTTESYAHRNDDDPWEDLASASCAAEYTAAVWVVLAEYTAEDAEDDVNSEWGPIRVRPGALERYQEAAAACITAFQARDAR